MQVTSIAKEIDISAVSSKSKSEASPEEIAVEPPGNDTPTILSERPTGGDYHDESSSLLAPPAVAPKLTK